MDIEDIHFKVAAARRILARNGCESRVAGHVSVRAPSEDGFYVSTFEYFDETLPDKVLKLSMDLTVKEGDSTASPAVDFHASIYLARPDVNSIIHTHSHYVSIVATTRETIGMYNVGSVLFYEDQAIHLDGGDKPNVFPDAIVSNLGQKRVLLIQNHGAIVASQSLEAATIEALMLEYAARCHVEARMIGGVEYPESAVLRSRTNYRKYFLPEMWDANLRRLEKSDPDLWEWLDGSAGDSART